MGTALQISSYLENSLFKRFRAGLSGQLAARAVTALNPILIIPILIRSWGVEGYGEWLILTALTSYFAYTNFGLVSTVANDVIMALSAQDVKRASGLYQNAVSSILYMMGPLLSLIAVGVMVSPVRSWLNMRLISQTDLDIVVALSSAQLLVSTIRGIAVSILYAHGRYGLGYTITASSKLIELGGIAAAVVFFHGGMAAVASTTFTVAIADLLVVMFIAYRMSPWCLPTFQAIDWSKARQQSKPAIGFALSNFSTQAVLLQGPRIVLGAMLGGWAVGTYSVYVTAMKLMDQLMLLVALPLEVEIAREVGRGDAAAAYRLLLNGMRFAWVAFCGVAVVLLAGGPLIFALWTKGRVPFSYEMMGLFVLMAAACQLGRMSLHNLMSTNSLYGPSFIMCALSLVSLGIGATLVPAFGLKGPILGGILGEVALSCIGLFFTARFYNVSVLKIVTHALGLGRATRAA